MDTKYSAEKKRRVAVLSRYPGETITVGDTVIRVLRIEGKRIAIYVEADEKLDILRGPKSAECRISSTLYSDSPNLRAI